MISFIQILDILVWPITILLAIWFFREIFTYLFFSMEEFNFFGAKGKIKNVREMIKEEANKLKRKEEENVKLIKLKQDLEKKYKTDDQLRDIAKSLLEDTRKAYVENDKLEKQIVMLNQQVNSLLALIADFQKQLGNK